MFDSLSAGGVVAAALIAPPDPELISALAHLDERQLTPAGAVDLVVAWERQAAWVAARTSSAVAHLAAVSRVTDRARPEYDLELSERSLQCEIAAATRLSELTTGSRIMVADELSTRLPMVAAALRAGDISYWHATAVCEAVSGLTDAQATWLANRVLPRARHQTLSQLRASLRRALMRITPHKTRKDTQDARTRHDVDLFAHPDGQAELRVTGDAADIHAIYRTIQDAARKLGAIESGSESPRTAGQLRIAALLALVTGTMTEAADAAGTGPVTKPYRVTVNVTMDLPTLLGLRDNPADLAGYGALPPTLARTLATDATWRRLLHEPVSGHLLDLGRLRYRPSAALADHIRTRDRTCIFPGCSRRAEACDLDHARPHRPDGSGGATDRHNLHALCKKHHRVKHETGWTLRTHETDAPIWISPTGHRYPVHPYDYRPPTDDDFDTPPEPEPVDPEPYVTPVDLTVTGTAGAPPF